MNALALEYNVNIIYTDFTSNNAFLTASIVLLTSVDVFVRFYVSVFVTVTNLKLNCY